MAFAVGDQWLPPSVWVPAVSISASLFFLGSLPSRVRGLCHAAPSPAKPTRLKCAKAWLSLCLSAAQLACLVAVWKRPDAYYESFPWTAANVVVSSAAILGLCLLSVLELSRCRGPSSDSTSAYLLVAIVSDSLWLLAPDFLSQRKTSLLLTCWTSAGAVFQLIFLILETVDGNQWTTSDNKSRAPEETASLLQRVFFWWVNPLLRKGTSHFLETKDLPATPQRLSSVALGRSVQQAWVGRGRPEGKAVLPLVLLRCLSPTFWSAIPLRALLVAFRYSQPVLIRWTIRFVSRRASSSEEKYEGFWILAAACFVYLGLAISSVAYKHRLNTLKVMCRGALIRLVYSGLLEARSDPYGTGSAVTLMSTDCESLSDTPAMFHDLLGYLMEVSVGMAMLSRELRWLWLVPTGLIFAASRVSRYVAQNLRSRQKDWVEATQERIEATARMLESMKAVKALGLADAIASQIRTLRVRELSRAGRIRWMMVVYNASANALGIFTPAATLLVYSLARSRGPRGSLDPETAFPMIAVLSMVTHPANMVMTIVPRAIATAASFERVQAYLVSSPRTDSRTITSEGVVVTTSTISDAATSSRPVVRFEHVTIDRPAGHGSAPILRDVRFEITEDHPFAFCSGPVGSGKSVLARAVLGELPPSRGTIEVRLPEGAGARIGFCAQSSWLPEGSIRDVVVLGDRDEWDGGMDRRSGAGVDVQRYEEAIRACCLDYDIASLPEGDHTLVGSRGMNVSGGQRQRLALARLVYSRSELVVLDDALSALDGTTADRVIQNLLGSDGLFRRRRTKVLWLSNNLPYFHLADQVFVLEDARLRVEASWQSLQRQPGDHTLSPPPKEEMGDSQALAKGITKLTSQRRALDDAAVDIRRKTGDLSLYGFYVQYSGWGNFSLMTLLTAIYSVFIMLPQYWLKWWTGASASRVWFFIAGYLLMNLAAWSSTSAMAWARLLLVAVRSGAGLHQMLLERVVGAPLSYFSSTETGIILNRFSQDIQMVDNDLPSSASGLIVQICKLLVQMALLYATQLSAILTLPVCILVVYAVQKYYLQTSRQLRFLDLEARSALFTSFLETAEGIVTIRAFGWQSQLESRNTHSLDVSQRAVYTFLCVQRWLNLVLDLTVAGVVVTVVALATLFRVRGHGDADGAAIGVALNVVLVANTTLLRLVELWAEFETSLGAVARLKGVQEDTPAEDSPLEDVEPAFGWPTAGQLDLRGVVASYRDSHKALRNVSLTIPAGSKYVICGRTGSGKSTLLLALLHLAEYGGAIELDGLDLARVPRRILRQRAFIAIPQDAFIMPHATLRHNIDAAGAMSGVTLVRALEKVHLWGHFSAHQQRHCASPTHTEDGVDDEGQHPVSPEVILDHRLSSLPVLSGGQTQLFTLARALVRREAMAAERPYEDSEENDGRGTPKPVLLLDEATSSLDPATEEIMHNVIDEEFVQRGHTVVLVTHRPDMLVGKMRRGRDAFVWMKDGTIERVVDAEEVLGQERCT